MESKISNLFYVKPFRFIGLISKPIIPTKQRVLLKGCSYINWIRSMFGAREDSIMDNFIEMDD